MYVKDSVSLGRADPVSIVQAFRLTSIGTSHLELFTISLCNLRDPRNTTTHLKSLTISNLCMYRICNYFLDTLLITSFLGPLLM